MFSLTPLHQNPDTLICNLESIEKELERIREQTEMVARRKEEMLQRLGFNSEQIQLFLKQLTGEELKAAEVWKAQLDTAHKQCYR